MIDTDIILGQKWLGYTDPIPSISNILEVDHENQGQFWVLTKRLQYILDCQQIERVIRNFHFPVNLILFLLTCLFEPKLNFLLFQTLIFFLQLFTFGYFKLPFWIILYFPSDAKIAVDQFFTTIFWAWYKRVLIAFK